MTALNPAPDAPTPADQDPEQARRSPGRPRAGSEDKRERILNEAVALFGARGYAGTSLSDIAVAAEISKAGLLHHFSSKEALFVQVLQRRDDDFNRGILEAVEADDTWAKFEAFVQLVEYNSRHRELVAIYTAAAMSVLDAEHPAHSWFAQHLMAAVTSFEGWLERGKELGVVRPEAPSRLIARTLTALSDGIQLQWLCSTTPGSASGPELGTDMVDEIRLFVDGLRAQWRIAPSGQNGPCES